MKGRDVYKVWAPTSVRWVDWVRPVPFVGIDHPKVIREFIDYDIPEVFYVDKLRNDTAFFIDIDGVDSIKEGISLANIGYRPIPLFNGTTQTSGAVATTNNEIVEELLIWGAYELKNIKIKNDAPPAFLLDVNRLNRYKSSVSVFDNSWDIYHQDVPSYKYLLDKGINRVVVRGEKKINEDLQKILYKYQKNGIQILFTDGYSEGKEVKVKKPKTVDF